MAYGQCRSKGISGLYVIGAYESAVVSVVNSEPVDDHVQLTPNKSFQTKILSIRLLVTRPSNQLVGAGQVRFYHDFGLIKRHEFQLPNDFAKFIFSMRASIVESHLAPTTTKANKNESQMPCSVALQFLAIQSN